MAWSPPSKIIKNISLYSHKKNGFTIKTIDDLLVSKRNSINFLVIGFTGTQNVKKDSTKIQDEVIIILGTNPEMQ